MKTTNKIILLICIMAFTFYSQAQDKSTKVDSLLSAYAGNVPGASLLIIHDGEKIYQHAYGMANLEEKIPVAANTNFRLASVTKEFTATAIMLLIERGKLHFNDNLTEIFPGFPSYGKKIKITNLLNHTSGLIDYEDLIPDTATVQVKDRDILQMMMEQDSTYFEPGSEYRYSNSAYCVLAMVVEKISGETFAEFLKENIFAPLGMTNSIAYQKGISTVKNRAYGYSHKDGEFVRDDQSITSAALGDGGIYTSVNDLFKWDQSLYTGKLLPLKMIRESFTRGTLNDGKKIDYGYGWHLKKFLGHEIVYHSGETRGFRNVIYRIPDLKFTVILLTNRNEGDTISLAEKMVSIYLNKEVQVQG